MSFEMKPLHPESIEKSLGKAHSYRLLNEPLHAESICLDVLCPAISRCSTGRIVSDLRSTTASN